eukprot:CAMPEP_0206807206 /NCGR_PEP_ID=MMETSP0975-20121206/5117_1 /ASSEMBLY_ACC=CAM_ASM_000399 /TAXON_ID=483370 /ORGANISM="non described non described, Strain CCMP2097" /LENGTH=89 /DNA_ID=CAMNT_0054349279 /DNA_START=18 /DNA_END=284 /DNA_ORIENTATION=-
MNLRLRHQDVVDGNVHKFDKEADEPDDDEADGRGPRDARELLAVGLGALLHEMYRVLDELLHRQHDHRIYVAHPGNTKPVKVRVAVSAR